MTDTRSCIDIISYPIFDVGQASSNSFFIESKAEYEKSGVLVLSGFVLPHVVAQMAEDARRVEHLSFKQEKRHNVYLADRDENFDENHPRNRQLITTNSTIADIDIQTDATLREVYQCRELHDFIAFVTGKAEIFPYVDALSPLNIGVSRPGETLAWHFDTSDFATTLLLQAPDAGGEFEYIARTRTPADPGYDTVAKLLAGELANVKTLNMEPGTLVLFQGRHSIHRVAPIKGEQTRLLAILTYDENPNQRMNAFTQNKFYGRTA